MSTEEDWPEDHNKVIHLNENTARMLLKQGGKLKPIAPAKAIKMDRAFGVELKDGEFIHGGDGDYLVLMPSGSIAGHSSEFIEATFKPVAKRTRKPKGE